MLRKIYAIIDVVYNAIFTKNPVAKLIRNNRLALVCGLFGLYIGRHIEDIYKREFDLF